MNKVMLFCSNPVNGGTAEMFAEMFREMDGRQIETMQFVPCVDAGNEIEVYNTLKGIVRLNIVSEAALLGTLRENRSFFERAVTRIQRNLAYSKVKRSNIKIMRDFLHKNDFQAIVIHNGGYIGDDLCNQMLQAAYQAKVKKRIMIFHNDFPKNIIKKFMCIGYDKKINCYATKTVTVSNYTRNRILKNSFLKTDMQVIYNGITFADTLSEQEKREILHYADADIHMGMIGNFQENKGQIQFLKALLLVLQETDKSIQVSMLGNVYDVSYFKQCQNFIKENSMQNNVSIFHGIYRAKEFMNLFDFTVVPSMYDESFGLICIESMRSGTPVICFACGGIPEVVKHERDGYVVPVGNVREMADSILRMINSPETTKQMGNWAKEDYETYFSRKIMGNKYMELLKEGD